MVFSLSYEEYFDSLKMPEITLMNLVSWVAATAMIFGGVVPFIPQYMDIQRTKNAEGFSLFVCLTLLIANILRIMFWFGKHFELPLLAQSIIMTGTMMLMVRLCVNIKHKSEIISSKPRYFMDSKHWEGHGGSSHTLLDFDLDYFWKWTDFLSYVEFMATFTVAVGMLTYLLLDFTVYIETIGFLAVFAEAMLGAPQFYRNYQNKSTVGMSKKMVGFWTMGDIFKTIYFILRSSPAQFWICGMLQVSIDISIFVQVYMYRHHPPAKVIKSARS
ncbi:solute carrier family 66 member 2-like isoform X1 [Haliotis rufescens]|uniref:solute carrier family 66 member 2-like isoform X1 n=1 Tax=Haliotis rufescens TaxID=6454 RepID=UPI001EB097FB|nr:solute carrier family 66 member 2-like isoform X1 [Haliotis rufescens]XP_046334949.1 solute carrier family 66 member 2-like isoform X1 [Haliotis rufescens]XP_046334951.1 solute carrier family 66 member 2-like isoform X1 [Haliotis rufescens]